VIRTSRKEFVVVSGKGGTGKSTLTSNLISLLSRSLKNVIVIDADADAPNLHLLLGVKIWDKVLSIKGSRVAYIDQERCIKCGTCVNVCPNLAIKSSDGEYYVNQLLCEGCASCAFVCPAKAFRFREVLQGKIKLGKTKYGYPLISAEVPVGRSNTGKIVTEEKNLAMKIINNNTEHLILTDSAAGIGCQVIASLVGANLAILVAEPTPASLSDLRRVYNLISHFGIPSVLVLNKDGISEKFKTKVIEFAKSQNIQLIGRIPYDENIPMTMSLMKPYVEIYPNSATSKYLNDIARKIQHIFENYSEWYKNNRPKPKPYIPKIIKPYI
jgi:MinD superfamily P-loop ATPase